MLTSLSACDQKSQNTPRLPDPRQTQLLQLHFIKTAQTPECSFPFSALNKDELSEKLQANITVHTLGTADEFKDLFLRLNTQPVDAIFVFPGLAQESLLLTRLPKGGNNKKFFLLSPDSDTQKTAFSKISFSWRALQKMLDSFCQKNACTSQLPTCIKTKELANQNNSTLLYLLSDVAPAGFSKSELKFYVDWEQLVRTVLAEQVSEYRVDFKSNLLKFKNSAPLNESIKETMLDMLMVENPQ